MNLSDVAGLDWAKGEGLLPAVVQHADTGQVLMLGYMDEEALRATLSTRNVTFFSRSKQRLWVKGETSGHYLELVEAVADCDLDTLLVKAQPRGPTCHTGEPTCFNEQHPPPALPLAFLGTLERVIASRVAERPDGSYTARLFAQGTGRLAQKVGEEGVEVALAAVTSERDKVVSESADLLFHLMLLLKDRGIALADVVNELEARHAGRSLKS
ncbi:MAG: bifunctional phosphoribosyl-AMP cyclohydrolase/phosphoribosyl-ATP diphosphatase HisIE [Steroidobacteraceae bacterium]|nr:bifunctional phosphoribosyl-AMP cyclohydrolase/phosphoribosyl-ATP diphosphatase HisIE [Steroidobacteraceae bacterium]